MDVTIGEILNTENVPKERKTIDVSPKKKVEQEEEKEKH